MYSFQHTTLLLHLVLQAVIIPDHVMGYLENEVSFFRIPPIQLLRALVLMRLKGILSERSLERALLRNAEFRRACGFERVPDHSTFSVFRKRLGSLLVDCFDALVRECYRRGIIKAMHIAVDSTAINAFSRNDLDASVGHKSENKTWFGFKAHIACCTKTELPIALTVTTASVHDSMRALHLIRKVRKQGIRFTVAVLDAAYDETIIRDYIQNNCQAKAIIDYNPRGTKEPVNIILEKEYDERTAIERLNSRLKYPLTLDNLLLKGLTNALQHAALNCMAVLCTALAANKQNKPWLARTITAISEGI